MNIFKRKRHAFFVYYQYIKGQETGVGSTDIYTKNKILSVKDIRGMEGHIKTNYKYDNVVISNIIYAGKEYVDD